MGTASLAGRKFRIDPEQVSFSYTVKSNSMQTLGGKVVQVYGSEIEDMTVNGRFYDWIEQTKFLTWIKGLATDQTSTPKDPAARPWRFLYPGKGWDLQVLIKGFSQPGGGPYGRAQYQANDRLAPRWSLQLFIVEDHGNLIKVAKNAAIAKFIERLTAGIGWKGLTEYNGPLDYGYVEQVLSGAGTPGSIQGYYAKVFTPGGELIAGAANAGTGGQATTQTTVMPVGQGYIRPVQGRVSSGFGPRGGRLHAGVDIAVATGTSVLAAADGTVSRVANDPDGYGLWIEIDHGGGRSTRYAHLSAQLVSQGQSVRQGQTIARSGNTGSSTGPHLHWETRQGGNPVAPPLG